MVSGPATISGATVTLTGAGTVVLQASEAADSNYAAGSKNATFTVGLGTPAIAFTVPNQTYGAAPFAVSATSNSTGAFTYSVVSGPATISGATVTLTGAGTVVLRRPKRPTATTLPPPRTPPSPWAWALRPSPSPWPTRPTARRRSRLCQLELDRGVHLHGGLGPGDDLGRDRHPDRGGHRGAHGV